MEGSSNSGHKATLALRPLVGHVPPSPVAVCRPMYISSLPGLFCGVFRVRRNLSGDVRRALVVLSTSGRITARSPTENQRSGKGVTQASSSRVSILYLYPVAMASVFRTIIPVVTPILTPTLTAPNQKVGCLGCLYSNPWYSKNNVLFYQLQSSIAKTGHEAYLKTTYPSTFV